MKFLKFTNQAAFLEAFADYLQADGQGALNVPSYIGASAVDVIGVIYKPTGAMLEFEGMQIPEMAAIAGWHVNLSGDCPADLEPYLIAAPSAPVRVFAGTTFLEG